MKRYLITLAALLWLLPMLAFAIGEQYGKITGIVYGPDGSELPGVKITLTSKALIGGPRTVYSSQEGAFTFSTLNSGSYELTATSEGFKTYRQSGIAVSVGKTVSLYIAMEHNTEAEDVVVLICDCRGLDITDNILGDAPYSTSNSDALPSGRSYQSIASFMPGVLGFDRQNPNIHGGSFRNNRYLVDGIDLTDPVTLTSSVDINFDAIQEVEVLTGGLPAEFNTFGGIINAVTESGSNDFELRGSFYLKNKTLSSDEQFSDSPFGGAIKGSPVISSPEGSSEASVVLGGPLIKDKFWYNAAVTHKSAVLPTVDSTDFDTITSRLKLTYQVNTKNTVTASGGAYPSFINSDLAGERKQGGYYATARLDSILRDNLLLKVSSGFQRSFFDTLGRAAFSETRDRLQNDVTLTYLKDAFFGSHQFKAGVQTAPSSFTKNETTFSAVEAGFFVQDEWKPKPFLAINPGVRFDMFGSSKKEENGSEQQIGYRGIGPRLGIGLDPTKDGKTKLTAYAGRFVEPGNLVLPSFASRDNVLVSCDASLVEDPSTAFLFEECRPPAMRELSFQAERLVDFTTTIGIDGIWRHQSHLFEDDEANLLYDESGTSIIGALNGDTSESIFRIRTPDEAFIDYKGIDLFVQGRPTEKTLVLASYTYSITSGTKDEPSNTQFTEFLDNPRQSAMFLGLLPWDSRHVLKLGGAYEFDFGMKLGFWYSYRAGAPFNEFVINESTGAIDRRAPRGFSAGFDPNDPSDDFKLALPDVNQFDVRAQYNAKKLIGQDFNVTFDIFNLFNAAAPLAVSELAGASFGSVIRRQDPFTAQIGVQYRY